MPSDADLVALAREHQAQQIRLTDRTVQSVDNAWNAFGGLSDQAAAAFTNAVVPIVSGALEATVQVTDAHLAQYMQHATGDQIQPVGLTAADVPYRGGAVDLQQVYTRPIKAARIARARGASLGDALQAGRGRARQLADTDVHLAARSSADAILQRIPRVQGYRRLPDGNACEYCLIASTQRYHVGTLAGIHPACHCSTVPIIGQRDPGRIINSDALQRLKAAGAVDEKDYARRVDDGKRIAGTYRDKAEQLERKAAASSDPLDQQSAAVWRERADERTAKLEADKARLTEIRARRAGSADAVKISDHSELGPVLRDSHGGATGRIEPPAPAPRRTRAKIDDPDVLAEAARRNVTPARVIEIREEKAQARYLEERARKEAAKNLSPDSPEVRALAEKYGVHPDEILSARGRVADIRAVAREQAARTQAEALSELERLDAMKIRSPITTKHAGGEYDFLEQTSDRERARLSRQWYGGALAPDQLAHQMGEILGQDLSTDEAMARWMALNRRSEAAGALRRGKLPSLDAYSGHIDPEDLIRGLSDEGYDVYKIFGDDLEAAAHIAHVEGNLVRDDALRYLGDAANPIHGPAPYRMGFSSWEGEVRDLEYAAKHGGLDALEQARYRELVPEYLDEPGLSYEELHARILSTARKAGERTSGEIQFGTAEMRTIPGQGGLFDAPELPLEPPKIHVPKVEPVAELGPPAGTVHPRVLFEKLDTKQEAKLGSTLDKLGRLHGAPVDGLDPVHVVLGGKTDLKGGHFSPAMREAKPRRTKTKTREQYQAEYAAWMRSKPRPEIRVNANSRELFSFIHEFGHRIDFQPTGWRENAAGNRALTGGIYHSRSNLPGWADFHASVRATATYKDAYTNFRGQIAYVSYWRSDEEVWARAYSQWAANRLGGAELESFRAMRASSPNFQWTDEEFATIAPHVEAILRVRGLLT